MFLNYKFIDVLFLPGLNIFLLGQTLFGFKRNQSTTKLLKMPFLTGMMMEIFK